MNPFDDLSPQAREISDPDERTVLAEDANKVERASKLVLQAGTNSEVRFTPTLIGPYRILERIGHGGMGDVFRAEQRQPIRRQVAIKLIRPGFDSHQVLARFEAERQALALMDHPHIARVLDAGADKNGRPYFVMEYVKGSPITEYADEKQLSLPERLELFRQVCQAVQHAHSKGVIHRDLKPGNILVSTQDGRPHAKVIDFGIAKATATPLTDKTLFTLHDQLIGTPAYMSPEQAEGSLDIDTRSDVYALGVLLYELLTGHTPVDAATLRQAAYHEIARIIKEHETQKPSTRLLGMATQRAEREYGKAYSPLSPVVSPPDPAPEVASGLPTHSRSVGPGTQTTTLQTLAKARSISAEALIKTVRGELDWLVMKALEKDRARRYDTASSLNDDIARYLEGQPIVAAPPGATYRMQKFIRKYRAPVLAAAALLTLMTAGILGTSWGLLREKEANEVAQTQAEISRRASQEAEQQRLLAEAAKKEAEQQKTTAEKLGQQAALDEYIANLTTAQTELKTRNFPSARARLEECPAEKRGWEWHHLYQQAHAARFSLSSDKKPLWFTPDGSRLLVQDSDKSLRLYDMHGGKDAFRIKAAALLDRSDVCFSADGRLLLVRSGGSNDTKHSVVLFDVASGREKLRLPDESVSNCEGRVLINADATLLAFDKSARVFRMDGSHFDLAHSPDLKVEELAFSPEGSHILTVTETERYVWDREGRKVQHDLGDHTRPDYETPPAFWQPPANPPILIQADGVRLWTIAGKEHIETTKWWPGGKEALSQDGARTARTKGDQTEVWNRGSTLIAKGMRLQEEQRLLRFNSDFRLLLANGIPNQVYDADSMVKLGSFIGTKGYGMSSDDYEGSPPRWVGKGSHLLWWDGLSSHFGVRLYDAVGQLIGKVDGGAGTMTSPDSKHILITGWRGDAYGMGYRLVDTDHFGKPVLSVQAWSDDQHWRLSEYDQPLPVLPPLSDDERRRVQLHVQGWLEGETEVRASRGQVELALRKIEGRSEIELRSPGSGWRKVVASKEELSAACLSPDASRILAVRGGKVVVWDAESGRELTQFETNEKVSRLAFSPGGSRLVLHLGDGNAEIWDSRPAADRMKDFEQRGSLWKEADAYISQLLKRDLPTDSLMMTAQNERQASSRLHSFILERLEKEIQVRDAYAREVLKDAKFRLLTHATPLVVIKKVCKGDPRLERRVQELLAVSRRDARSVELAVRGELIELIGTYMWGERMHGAWLADDREAVSIIARQPEFMAALKYWGQLPGVSESKAYAAYRVLEWVDQGKLSEAIKELSTQAASTPLIPEAVALLAALQAQTGALKEAHQSVNKLLKDSPTDTTLDLTVKQVEPVDATLYTEAHRIESELVSDPTSANSSRDSLRFDKPSWKSLRKWADGNYHEGSSDMAAAQAAKHRIVSEDVFRLIAMTLKWIEKAAKQDPKL